VHGSINLIFSVDWNCPALSTFWFSIF